jgi:phosphate-selective porin OprO/OprP
MKLTKLSLAMASVIGAGFAAEAMALDLYVDTKTQQIFAEPGKGRAKLGSFEKVEEQQAKKAELIKPEVATKSEINEIKNDLELKANELKALEEHVVATREEKDKNAEKWFNKINVRGYTQLRYNQKLTRLTWSQQQLFSSPCSFSIFRRYE